ncbi:MAG TPA: glycosyltransferase [Acidobacteriota bacterium]|nr:glycosyltransferase [Acidobacteriota bacterium]
MPAQINKILYLIDELQPAGTEKQLILLAESLRETAFAPIIGVLQPTLFQSDLKLDTPIVNFDRSGLVGLKNLTLLLRLRKFIEEEEIAIVQTNLVDSGILGAIAVRFSKLRPILIATRRNAYHLRSANRLAFHFNKIVARWADAVVANSIAVVEKCVQQENISRNRIHLIENGVDLSRFGRVPTNRAKEMLELGNRYPVIGVVANLRPIKGLIHFLDAAQILLREFPSACFVIVGRGPQKQELLERARRHRISERICFLDKAIEIAEAMAAFDIAVQCSISESFSNVLIEYMASAKPIVATRVGDAERIIQDGAEGLIIEPENPEAISEAVASLLRAPEQALEMGTRAREKAERNWTIARLSANYQALYNALLDPVHSMSAHSGLESAEATAPVSRLRL